MKNFLKKRHANKLVNFIACLIIFLVLTLVCGNFAPRSYRTIIISICISIVMAVSLNVSAGSLGEIVLGHAGFMAIGAYCAALYLTHSTITNSFINYIFAILIGGFSAGVAGVIVGIPTLRLRGDYLAIVTLGFGEAVRCIINNISITNGASGLKNIPNMLSSSSGPKGIALACATMMFCVTVIFCFMTSRHGRAILSIREDEVAAESSGIPVTIYKVLAFTVSAIFAGIGGAMYCQTIGSIYPSNFNLNQSVDYLVMVVFGGLGSYTGSILAAIVLTVLNISLVDFAEFRMIIYSIILILIMIFKPSGLFGIKEFSLRNFIINFKTIWRMFIEDIKSYPNKIKKIFTKKNKRINPKEIKMTMSVKEGERNDG